MREYTYKYKQSDESVLGKVFGSLRLTLFKSVVFFDLSEVLTFLINNTSPSQKDLLLLNVIADVDGKVDCCKVLDKQGIPFDQGMSWNFYCLKTAQQYNSKSLLKKALILNEANDDFIVDILIDLVSKKQFKLINVLMNNTKLNVNEINRHQYRHIFNTRFRENMYSGYGYKTINRLVKYIVDDFKEHNDILSIIKIMKKNKIDYKKYTL